MREIHHFIGGAAVRGQGRRFADVFEPSMVRAKDFENALVLASDHIYGNGVAVFTRNGDMARQGTCDGDDFSIPTLK
jgi:acyl-CoA reductase-like NAD-dependent aldehyde dehydrogenase